MCNYLVLREHNKLYFPLSYNSGMISDREGGTIYYAPGALNNFFENI